jgi:hypothetical protein
MRPKLFTFASAASLMLCIGTVILWVRSYWYNDALSSFSTGRVYRHAGLVVGRGGIWLFALAPESSRSKPTRLGFQHDSWLCQSNEYAGVLWPQAVWPAPSRANRLGFVRLRQPGNIIFPIWVATAATLILPAFRLLPRTRRQSAEGTCPSCGYDLRATRDRCPECGYVPQRVTT